VNNNLSIEVRSLCKSFEGRRILDGVSLSVTGGQTVALVGPSGGGKSTLLRCLNTFDAGEIQVGDHHLRPSTPINARAVRRLLGMIFQDFQLFPHMTALENVIEAPLHVLHLERAKAVARGRDLLKRVGLGDRGSAYPRQLSGGQKQRVAIARALAMEPRGLLCDEITSSLDPELKNEVLAVLEDLKQDGLTLLMVTHEIGFARRAADRVVVLADGKIVEEGPPEQVLDCPQHPRTQTFLRRVLG
jgi:polar amino acid transport system ATP-binding protein